MKATLIFVSALISLHVSGQLSQQHVADPSLPFSKQPISKAQYDAVKSQNNPPSNHRVQQGVMIDYDAIDEYETILAGGTYERFIWDMNTHYPSNPAYFALSWGIVRFDTLGVLDGGGNIQTYPRSSTPVTIDSITALITHQNNTGSLDTVLISVYEWSGTLGFTVNPQQQVTNVTLWDTMIITNSSLSPGANMLAALTVYPDITLTYPNNRFLVGVHFYGDTANTFTLLAGYSDRCGSSCYAAPSVFDLNSIYRIIAWSSGIELTGINPLAYDCNQNLNVGEESECELFPIQNFAIQCNITIDPILSATVSPAVSACPGETITLSATAAGGTPPYNYSWSPSGGLSNPFAPTTSATVTSNITYSVTVSDGLGTSVVKTVPVTVNGITINAGADQQIGCGQTADITCSVGDIVTGATFQWSNGPTTLNQQNVGPGTYSITATNIFGCSATDAVTISSQGVSQVLSFTTNLANSTGCRNDAVQFTNTSSRLNGWNWTWTFGNGATSSISDPSFTYTNTGVYTVTLSADSAGCTVASFSRNIMMNNCSGGPCTPGIPTGNPGLQPEWQLLPCVEQGVFYVAVIGIENFDSVGGVAISQLRIDSITNLPAGLTYTVNPSNATLPGGGTGCIDIAGTTNDPTGSYQLGIYVTVTITGIGNISGEANQIVDDLIAIGIIDTTIMPAPDFSYFIRVITAGGACTTTGISCGACPNAGITTPGYFPAPDAFPCVERSVAYNECLQLNIPASFDTVVGGTPITITVNSVHIDNITGMPTGISYNCGTCTINGGGSGCINFSGTTNAGTGQYPLTVTATANLTIPGLGNQIQTLDLATLGYTFYLNVINPGSACQVTCNQPNAAFAYNQNNFTFTFTDQSTNTPTAWLWNFGDGGTSTQKNPVHTFPGSGTYTVCVTATNSCGPNSTCQNITITCNAPAASFTYLNAGTTIHFTDNSSNSPTSWSWTFGDGSSSTQRHPSHTYTTGGTYSVCVTATNSCGNNTSCQSVTVTCPTPTAAFTYSVSGTSVSFTDNSSGSPSAWSWTFGNGSSSTLQNPSHSYTGTGAYTVCLTAANGCGASAASCQTVTLTCGISASITTAATTLCTGDTALLVAPTGVNYSYQWYRNGSLLQNATTSTFETAQSGSYTVAISDGNCSATSAAVVITFVAPPQVSISSSGSTTFCPGGSVTLIATPGFVLYQWSTGSTAASITAIASGTYSVTATDNNGCSASSDFSLNTSTLNPPELCIIGVDSATNKNMLVWEKPVTTAIDSYVIYKETNVADVYVRIASQPYSAFSTYIDNASNPQQQAYRYQLGIIDSCGSTTLAGAYHKTIHLTINQGVGTTWNLIWSHYEGISVGSYNIYRGSSQTGLSLLTTISGNLDSYSDLSPPAGTTYYQIEVVHPDGCTPTAKMTDYSVSKSNIVNSGMVGIGNIAAPVALKIYPNPFTQFTVIEIPDEVKGTYDLRVIDLLGNEVKVMNNLADRKLQLDRATLANGIYFVEVRAESRYFGKVVVE